jgi:shikimate dehydrogenase
MHERILVGLIGANIQKSLSPALHEDALAAAGLAGHYHLMDLDCLHGRKFADLLNAARTAGFAGVNVTFPCKEEALALMEELSPEAREIGAINTITFNAGRMIGHNTDRIGFRRSFEQSFGRDAIASKVALLVGAGGAGRAAACALADLGAECLLVHDKEPARADALVASLAASFGTGSARAITDIRSAMEQAAGVVNATQVGMLGYPGNPIPSNNIEERHWVMDVIYTPLETELVRSARARGARTAGGADMCIYQAAEAFRLFTGIAPDVERMRRTFMSAASLRERSLATVP